MGEPDEFFLRFGRRTARIRPGFAPISRLPWKVRPATKFSLPPDAYLVLTNVAPAKWSGKLSATRQTIGRGDDAELRLPGEYVHVSRCHAVVWTDSAGHWITDLGSTSGTRVNGVPLVSYLPFRLQFGDHLWVGAAELDVVVNPDQPARRRRRQSPESTVRYSPQQPGTVEFAGAPPEAFAKLTPAELDIVLWISRGYTDPEEVAESIYRSPHTVRTHLANIYAKLNVHSRDQLLACLVRRGGDTFADSTEAPSTSSDV